MNNNRNSNNNRRRGRNNNNRQQSSGGGNQLNRIDSRTRGNAPQLLDKYKKLAQDAQHNGDRVQAEYFLQYADHYFRVINDNKVRQDEARAQRGDRGGRDDQNDGPNNNSNNDSSNDSSNDSRGQRDDDDNRRPRRSRPRQDDGDESRNSEEGDDQDDNERGNTDRAVHGRTRSDNGRGRSNGSELDYDSEENSDETPVRKPAVKAERAPRKPRAAKPSTPRPPTSRPRVQDQGEIDIAALPPAIGAGSDDEPVKKKPALRPRRKRADDSEAVG